MLFRSGLIAQDRALRKTHVGRTLHQDDDPVSVFRDDTLAADDKAFFLKVRDVVEAAVSETTFRQVAQKMQKARDIRLTGDPVKAIEVLANRYTLNESERAGVLRHLIVEGDLSHTVERLLPRIGHMQLADVPGRHEPGTGEINYPFLFGFIDKLGYAGWIGCEYKPRTTTVDGLAWIRPYLPGRPA